MPQEPPARHAHLLKLAVEAGQALDALHAAPDCPKGHRELVFRCELVTPALIGGAHARQPDADQVVRAKDVRGKLRMWWRILARAGDLKEELGHQPSYAADQPSDLENRVWGSIHGDSGMPGLVRIQVQVDPSRPAVSKPYEREYTEHFPDGRSRTRRVPNDEFSPFRYALEFAKAPAREPVNRCRPITCRGHVFRLTLRLTDPGLEAAVLKTVNAWMRFGGVGGRNSRGMGAVLLTSQTAGVELARLPKLNATMRMRIGEFPSAESAVKWGLQCLQQFCQGEVGRNGHVGRMGRSRWPEADTVRRITGQHFDEGIGHHRHDPDNGLAGLQNAAPRLALGHRTIRFHPDQTAGTRRPYRQLDPSEHTLLPAGAERVPSSLLIRPAYSVDNGTWSCLLVQLTDLAAQIGAMRVQVRGPAGVVDVPVWRTHWIPGADGGCDGVSALEDEAVEFQVGQPGAAAPRDLAQVFMNYAWNQRFTARERRHA